MGFLGAITAFSVFSDDAGQSSGYRVVVGGEAVTLCLPGDELSHTVLTPDPDADGHSTPWAAAEAIATAVQDDAGKDEFSASMREALGPARAFKFDIGSEDRKTGDAGRDLITYDSSRPNEDGTSVLTSRVLIEEKSNGSFVSEVFICTSETYTDLATFRQASSQFYGEIPNGIKTAEELD